MKPFPVLPHLKRGSATWPAAAPRPTDALLLVCHFLPAPARPGHAPGWAVSWAVSTTAPHGPMLWLGGPGGPTTENQEEDEEDLELENDEDHHPPQPASARPGTDEGSPAARGDGTINPPFP